LDSTFWDTVDENKKSHLDDDSKTPGFIDDSGGADGARTRDLQRDRLIIDLLKEG
jgi:hypothetical protein